MRFYEFKESHSWKFSLFSWMALLPMKHSKLMTTGFEVDIKRMAENKQIKE